MWCGEPVTGQRRNWCSDECVSEWRIRRDPQFARRRVKKRDRGVCSRCGRDTLGIERFLLETMPRQEGGPAFEEWHQMFKEALGLGVGARVNGYWDMDHITPVVEGGGGCGLSNLRTLCIPCHRGATAELAARRAAERRPQRELPLEETG
jgi:5-methylcytosine-specific restriction endonuclease McrA